MARAYSGVLGAIALCFVIVRGLVNGLLPDEILSQGLVVFFLFGIVGFLIGTAAEKTISESVENRFRSEMARMHAAATETKSETSER